MSRPDSDHDDDGCPVEAVRLAHLEETTRFALDALDTAASLSDFSLSVSRLEGPLPILRMCAARVRGLLPFSEVGFMLVDEEDSSFSFALCEPEEARESMEAFAGRAIEEGLFAFALREKRAVVPPVGQGDPRMLLHVMTTASRTRGMFVARLRESSPELSEVTLSILSILLGNAAQALESHFLYRRIQKMNRELCEKVDRLAHSEEKLRSTLDNQDGIIREKTGELIRTMDRLEDEVRCRKRAETLLEALNQRLEAKVELRTKALFRKVAEMEQANKQLKQLERLKSGFLSSVSHELRTPLTSILGFVKLVERDFGRHFMPESGDPLAPRAERLVRNLEIVEKESERLTRLINDVLDLTRIESGKMVWRDEPLGVHQLVLDAVTALEGRLENRPGVILVLDIPVSLPAVEADRDRILQVLINLMDNAFKFTTEGCVRVFADARQEGMLTLGVEDTGPGISPEEAEKIFDKFHQHASKDTLKDKPPGTGLGLAICRHIVGHYGGSIWVEPSASGGSVFQFTLPIG